MKLLTMAVLLAAIQASAPVPRKAPDNAAGASTNVRTQPATQETPPSNSAPLANQNQPMSNNGNSPEKTPDNTGHTVNIRELPPVSVIRDWADWGTWGFTLLLAITSLLQVWLLCRTLTLVRRQAHEMKRQRGFMRLQWKTMQDQAAEMKRQVTEMGRQTDVLQKSVSAAEKSAKAAGDSVELIIKKERARLTIDVSRLALKAHDIWANHIPFNINFVGVTPAFVLESKARAEVNTRPIPDPSDRFSLTPSIPEIIKADVLSLQLPIIHVIGDTEITDIEEGRLFVHFYGFVKYRDIFDVEHETCFCFSWRGREITQLRVAGTPPVFIQSWQKTGFNGEKY